MAGKKPTKPLKKHSKTSPKPKKGKSPQKAKKSSPKATKVIVSKPVYTPIRPKEIFPEETIKNIITYRKRGPSELTYKPEYTEMILRGMAQGMTIESVCAYIGVSKSVLSGWCKKNKEIKEIIKLGKELSEAWWTEQGRQNIFNRDFNHVLWMMNMSNRFKWSTNNGKVVAAHLHKHQHKHEHTLEEKIKDANKQPERVASVISILAKSGALTKPEPARRIRDTSDSEAN